MIFNIIQAVAFLAFLSVLTHSAYWSAKYRKEDRAAKQALKAELAAIQEIQGVFRFLALFKTRPGIGPASYLTLDTNWYASYLTTTLRAAPIPAFNRSVLAQTVAKFRWSNHKFEAYELNRHMIHYYLGALQEVKATIPPEGEPDGLSDTAGKILPLILYLHKDAMRYMYLANYLIGFYQWDSVVPLTPFSEALLEN
jgi:hypothetical protein